MRLPRTPLRAPAAPAIFRLATLCTISIAAPLAAQSGRPAKAFMGSVTPYLGMTSFGDRFSDVGGTYRYSGSFTVGTRADLPLTRRSGVLIDLSVAPLAGQSAELATEKLIGDRLLSWRATLGLGWRFKPAAPVFLSVGGGVVGATKPPVPETSGSQIEPEAMFALGYDGPDLGRWNVRGVYAGHFVKPSTSARPAADATSPSYDWTLMVGLRYTPGGARTVPGTP